MDIAGYAFRLPSLVMLVTAGLSTGVAVTAWRRRRLPGATPLLLLQIATAVWSGLAAFEVAASTPAAMQGWGQLAYLGIATAPLFYFLFSVEYTQDTAWLTGRRRAALWLIPVITLALVATNDWHHWHWASVTLDPATGLGVYGRGPWFWVHVGYSYSLLLAGVLVLVRALFSFPPYYRRQVISILAGSTPPLLVNVIYILNPRLLPGLDWTPVGLAFSGVALAWGLFRAGLLELAPIARNQLVEKMAEGVVVLNLQQRVVDANSAAERLFGRSLIGQASPLPELTLPAAAATQRLDFPAAGRVLEAQTSPLLDPRRLIIGWLILLRDITDREHAAEILRQMNERLQAQLAEVQGLQAQLREETIRDPLTGAFNRRYLQETLPRELAMAGREDKPLCVVMLDLDHFKNFNDSYGHAAGDAVLQGLVALLSAHIRQGDAICRYGGEEFVVIMSNVAVADAQRRAEAWRRAFADLPLAHAGQALAATISLGVAAFPAHAQAPEDLLRHADAALYAAKAAGRNRVAVWEPAPPAGGLS